MTQTFQIHGRRTGIFSTLARAAFLAVAAVGGIFILVFATAFALFAVAGIAVIGFIIFAFFWTKAKLTGKPFGPRAQFEQMRKDMESQMSPQMGGALNGGPAAKSGSTGPVVDAHQTPDGWSVDD